MTKEQEKAIEWLENKPQECTSLINSCSYIKDKKAYAKYRTMFKIVLNLIQQLQEENKQKTSLYKHTMNELRRVDEELAEKETIIENAINEVENLRQDFSEDVQPDFVRILEILKNKKVIDW